MPYLIVIAKNSKMAVSIDEKKLSQNLCPYDGSLEKSNFQKAQIFHSGFVGKSPEGHLKFPKDHHQEQNSAWGTIQIGSDILKIQTDPMGLLPVWIWKNENFTAIASEMKAFQTIQGPSLKWKSENSLLQICKRSPTDSRYEEVQRLKPGRTLEINLSSFQISETGTKDLDFTPDLKLTSVEARRNLKTALLQSVSEVPTQSICTFLSGGIDSSVATSLLSQRAPGIRSLTLGSELGNEFKEASEVAAHRQIRHSRIDMQTSELRSRWEKVIWQNEVYDGLTSEILCQMDALTEKVAEAEKQVLTGYGADLLFGGMLRHQAYMAATGVTDNPSLIERTSWSLEFSPFSSWAQGARQFHLYWHPEVLKAALKIPLEMNFDGPTDKVQLRTLAVEENWLPRHLAFREKIGMTNGTSVHILLSRVLGLSADYAYAEKTKLALDIIKRSEAS